MVLNKGRDDAGTKIAKSICLVVVHNFLSGKTMSDYAVKFLTCAELKIYLNWLNVKLNFQIFHPILLIVCQSLVHCTFFYFDDFVNSDLIHASWINASIEI